MTEVWPRIVKSLEHELDAKELKTWFAPTRQLSFVEGPEGATLTVGVPNRVFADWIGGGPVPPGGGPAGGFPGVAIRFSTGIEEPTAGDVAPAAAPRLAPGLILNPRF